MPIMASSRSQCSGASAMVSLYQLGQQLLGCGKTDIPMWFGGLSSKKSPCTIPLCNTSHQKKKILRKSRFEELQVSPVFFKKMATGPKAKAFPLFSYCSSPPWYPTIPEFSWRETMGCTAPPRRHSIDHWGRVSIRSLGSAQRRQFQHCQKPLLFKQQHHGH